MNPSRLLAVLDRPVAGLAAFLVFGGAVSLLKGVDASWDLANYHFYNPWAWLHDRLAFDYAPAQMQSYHSPLLDLPFYGLVRAGTPAAVVAFAMGFPFGIAAYFYYRIARGVVADVGVARTAPALALIGLVGLTGAAGLSQVGSTMNEWSTAALVLAALALVVAAVREAGPVRAAPFAGAGALAGLAVGGKLPAAVYAAALLGASAACVLRRPGGVRAVAAYAAGCAAGFTAAYGYWAWVLWERFANPFFPYFNDLFRSEYWDPVGFRDVKFRPTKLNQWLTLPFKLAERNRLVGEAEMRDPRLAVLIIVAVALAASLARTARAQGTRFATLVRERMPASVACLALFAVVAYVLWLALFTIYRYAIPLELVASLLLVLALRAAFAGGVHRDALVAVFAGFVVVATYVPYWGRAPLHLGPAVDAKVPPVPGDALVMIFTQAPLGYVVPFIGSGARVIRPASNFTGPGFDHRLQREMAALVAAQQGAMYVLRRSDERDPGEEVMLVRYALRRDAAGCLPVPASFDARLVLCPLLRVAETPR
jgi:hypothetical protein